MLQMEDETIVCVCIVWDGGWEGGTLQMEKEATVCVCVCWNVSGMFQMEDKARLCMFV